MTTFVADTSGLVSLGIVADADPDPLSLCLDRYDLLIPEAVLEELRDTAEYDDKHGRAATTILEQTEAITIQSVELDADFPLDEGENATVTLANENDAALVLCDEFTRLGVIHASLVDTRLVTTPTLLSVLVRADCLGADEARPLLEEISTARSWETNSYVQRAKSLLDGS